MEKSTNPQFSLYSEYPGFSISNTSELQKWVDSVFASEQKEYSKIAVHFCSDEELLKINRRYLKHKYYTDIITFPYQKNPIEGELYISIERVKENAIEWSVSFREELCRVIVHGLLHLIGYKDCDEVTKKQMRAKEDYYLSLLADMENIV